jgi:hypothetical protein
LQRAADVPSAFFANSLTASRAPPCTGEQHEPSLPSSSPFPLNVDINMATTEQLNALLAETGAILELAEVIGFESENLWTLEVDETTILFVDHEANQHRIVLSGEVVKPHDARKISAYELLLQYNNQWKSTGGLRMALDGPGGSINQICDISTVDLNAHALADMIRVFVDVLRGWRDMLASEPSGSNDRPFGFEQDGFIRA